MNYKELLGQAIDQSDLSLSKISMELNKLGFKSDKSYLSKLQNGKLPPAGDKFNEALAKVLGIDAIKLKTAAYREKIPEEVLEKLKDSTT